MHANIRFVLRELPGVIELEDRLRTIQRHPNPSLAPELDGLDEAVDQLSRRLFDIDAADTQFDEARDWPEELDYEAALAGWEAHFEVAEVSQGDPAEYERLIWSLLGWDVADAHGLPLLCVAYLDRQMTCASKGLLGRPPTAPVTVGQDRPGTQERAAAPRRTASPLARRSRAS